MHKGLAIWSRQPGDFFSAKGLFVKFDGFTGPLHDQVRGQRVIAFGNCIDPICHFLFPFSFQFDGVCAGSANDERADTFRTLRADFIFAATTLENRRAATAPAVIQFRSDSLPTIRSPYLEARSTYGKK